MQNGSSAPNPADTRGSGQVDISIAIPTYNEAKTIADVVKRISQSFKESGVNLEFIVIDDDSPDGTATVAEQLKNEYNVKVVVRKGERGLATAVVRGWREASGKLLAVIDADLQHPPEVLLHLYTGLTAQKADMAVASRKAAGGGTKDWDYHRVVISTVATAAARFILPVTLFKIRDATTGCFMFKRECVDLSKLSPLGFKIFLEVMVRGKFAKSVEVAYVFNQRSLGQSKLTVNQNFIFIYHLLKLSASTGEIIVPVGIALALAASIAFLF